MEEDSLNGKKTTLMDKILSTFSVFKPTKGYFITPILININIGIFILMILTGVNAILPDTESLLNWGANYKALTLNGEPWRLLSNCFLHIGAPHLLMNMYALILIGALLEPIIGRTKFLLSYLFLGVAASLTSCWWNDNSVSAGASGAIFGMYGLFISMLTTNLIEKSSRKPILTSILVFVGFNLLYGLKGGIDNAAHIGGLINGTIIGYALYPSIKIKNNKILNNFTNYILPFCLLFLIGLFYFIMPFEINNYDIKNNISTQNNSINQEDFKELDDYDKYIYLMKEFEAMESMAMESITPKNWEKEEHLKEIKTRGLYYWNENIKLIKKVDSLNLSEIIHQKNKKLLKYCELRINCYLILYKSIEEETNKYDDELKEFENKIFQIKVELSNEQIGPIINRNNN